jgi:hypothetical protein
MDPKTALVVLFAFCSMPTGDCSLVAIHPQGGPTFENKQECRAFALALNSDKSRQEDLLEGHSLLQPPYNTHAVCGTIEEKVEILQFLHGKG